MTIGWKAERVVLEMAADTDDFFRHGSDQWASKRAGIAGSRDKWESISNEAIKSKDCLESFSWQMPYSLPRKDCC
jgi:hypothetical protein